MHSGTAALWRIEKEQLLRPSLAVKTCRCVKLVLVARTKTDARRLVESNSYKAVLRQLMRTCSIDWFVDDDEYDECGYHDLQLHCA